MTEVIQSLNNGKKYYINAIDLKKKDRNVENDRIEGPRSVPRILDIRLLKSLNGIVDYLF